MKKTITTLLSLMILLLVGCSNKEIPNHLVFEGENEHWHPKVVIKQSKSENHFGKYNYLLNMRAEYIGEDFDKLEMTKDLGVKWRLESDDDVEEYGGTYSDFQKIIGGFPGGSLTETNASKFYTPKNAEIKIIIEWAGKKEVIPLEPTTVEYN